MAYTITISQKRYAELLIAESKLQHLEAGGVDNWDWFSESLNGEDGEQSHWDYEDVVSEQAKNGELKAD